MREKKSGPAASEKLEVKPEKTFNVRAIDRALSVLLSFRPSEPALSLTQVARHTGLDKGTARRILLTLVHHAFIVHDPSTKKYQLGPAVMRLAAAVTNNHDFREAVRPILKTLGERARMCVNFAVRRDFDAVNIERYEPIGAFIMTSHWRIGGRLPLNIGAAPRLLLAAMSDAQIDDLLGDPEKRKALAQPVDARKIRADIEKIRAQGWAVSVDEYALGVTSVGVPVKDSSGRVVAAMSIIGMTPQLVKGEEIVYLPDLLTAATELSEGYSAEYL